LQVLLGTASSAVADEVLSTTRFRVYASHQ
jgi:hypothetical protein